MDFVITVDDMSLKKKVCLMDKYYEMSFVVDLLSFCFPFLRGVSFNAEPYISLSQHSSFSVKWPQSVFDFAMSLKSGI